MVTLCEVGQTEKEKYCMMSQRNDTNELIYERETDSGLENKLTVAGGKDREEVVRECGRGS